MSLTLEIPNQLFTAFNNVKYYDEPHKYYVNNKELVSVTTLIHRYQEEFDEDYWSEYKANQHGVKKHHISRAWDFINKKGTIKGSAIHDYTENLFYNKKFDYPKEKIFNEFGFDPVIKEYVKTKQHVDKFYNDSFGKLMPIKAELVIYDEIALIGGMVDMLFYNIRAGEFQIWDWKTNKDFTFECKKRHLLHDLFVLEDCDLEIYSLQLQFYKYIIEKYTNIKLGKSYLVWFSHNNPSYQIIETKDRSFYIDKMVQNRMNEINMN